MSVYHLIHIHQAALFHSGLVADAFFIFVGINNLGHYLILSEVFESVERVASVAALILTD